MGSLAPFYAAARAEFGLAEGQEYRDLLYARPGPSGSRDREFARWTPAETAVIRFYRAAGSRLRNPTSGLPFQNAASFVATAQSLLGFTRSHKQFARKYKRLVSWKCSIGASNCVTLTYIGVLKNAEPGMDN